MITLSFSFFFFLSQVSFREINTKVGFKEMTHGGWRGSGEAGPGPRSQPAADACPALPSLAGQTRPEPRGCGSALRLRGTSGRDSAAPPARPAPPSARAAASPPPPPAPRRLCGPGRAPPAEKLLGRGGGREKGRRERQAWTRRAAEPAREVS